SRSSILLPASSMLTPSATSALLSLRVFFCSPCSLFLSAPSPPEFSSLSLHDALPISMDIDFTVFGDAVGVLQIQRSGPDGLDLRSEEHTSELQSRFDLVCRLLLEKKTLAIGGRAEHAVGVEATL